MELTNYVPRFTRKSVSTHRGVALNGTSLHVGIQALKVIVIGPVRVSESDMPCSSGLSLARAQALLAQPAIVVQRSQVSCPSGW